MKVNRYDKPHYYHIAFDRLYESERRMIESCFIKHVSFPVKSVLEAACGTGRLLVDLPKHGYQVTGYDLSPEMVAYSIKRVTEADLHDSVTVVHGDMAAIEFDQKFDAALNLINSIGYLLEDEDILSHLRHTGDSIRSGGIYVVHLGCAPEHDKAGSTSWEIDLDGVSGTAAWGTARFDRNRKLVYEYFKMDANDNGTRVSFKDDHILRLWLYEDIQKLIKESGKFRLEEIYDEDGKSVDLDSNITGSMGNLFYVLKRL